MEARYFILAALLSPVLGLGCQSRGSSSPAPEVLTRNLGLAAGGGAPCVDGRRVAFFADEASSGLDLNEDGDREDVVVHVHDVLAGTTQNLHLAGAGSVQFLSEWLAFPVPELGQGNQDLNGDGDRADLVIHLVHLGTGQVRNLGLAASSLQASAGILVARVDEAGSGSTDLNGDGDAEDSVVHLYDPVASRLVNLGLAGFLPIGVGSGFAGMPVSEHDQGETDLNGDGDAEDSVLHLIELASGRFHNLQLAAGGVVIEGGYAAFTVDERTQGAMDLNGDGDADDEIQHLIDLDSGLVTNLGLASFDSIPIDIVKLGPYLLTFPVPEDRQGFTDLNLDGDSEDLVVFVHDLRTNVTINVKRSGFPLLSGTTVTFTSDETSEGGRDLNGDGDALDPVLHVYDGSAGTLENLGLSAHLLAVSGSTAGLAVREENQGGRDLNGDGDAIDAVVHLLTLADRSVVNLGLAVESRIEGKGLVAGSGFLVYGVLEEDQGRDLNGDGDLFDEILHVSRLVGLQVGGRRIRPGGRRK